jgi:hypothetical protein
MHHGRIPLLVGLLLTMGAAYAEAMIQVSCRIESTPAMLHETVLAHVQITNRSGRPITVDPNGPSRLRFIVERKAGYPIDARKKVLPYEATEIPTGQTGAITVNLNRCFDLVRTGPLTIRALLLHNGQYYQSSRALLDIVPGFEIASVVAAAPSGGYRKYSLRTLTRGRGQSVFIQIDDPANNLCYGVYELGQTLAMHQPTMETDRLGRVHILHQSGPTRFTHSVFDADGRPVEHRYFSKGPSMPKLIVDEDGEMKVGGVIEYVGDSQASRPVIRPFNPFE